MYHGVNDGPASWFILSVRQGHIISAWKAACDEYWRDREEEHTYQWMDALFNALLKTDPKFSEDWSRVPNISCEAPGQAHMLAGYVLDNDPGVETILRENPPYALKLTRHFEAQPNELVLTNIVRALDASFSDVRPAAVVHS